MNLLKEFAPNLYFYDTDFSLLGLEIGNRMTIIKLNEQNHLMIHSPTKVTADVVDEIKSLGEVKYILAPNRWHHLFVSDIQKYFPDAKIYGAPGLEKKRKDISFDTIIEDDKPYPWSGSLKHKVVWGSSILNEVVLYHAESKSLVVTDVGLHVCEEHATATKIAFMLMMSFKKFGWTPLEKLFLISNKKKFKASIEEILKWDFDKVILSHGRLVHEDGKALFKEAFA